MIIVIIFIVILLKVRSYKLFMPAVGMPGLENCCYFSHIYGLLFLFLLLLLGIMLRKVEIRHFMRVLEVLCD